MNTLKDFLNNNKKYVYLMISILVIAVIIIVAVLVNIIKETEILQILQERPLKAEQTVRY